ncbi:NAD(P)-dependent dehydrogenase (short-subunit alcohol dehydrogenase family) [Rhodococcus sp. SMB37]|uniref:oxidoreductase n=1 Tax=Rhodococcus sp. SMB37 TaxID=2512213 RepID=UPI001047DFA3|nr:oxidoreductase [Rhodococcus sp. SMB37]TCN52851.1 NAD(P)-dependent dehydrogenase (short-subunit alcohol dehydrogenase family) [Rhodococcus sp. SMB37]
MVAWTAQDIPDQTGRTFVVTGANSGLGAETTRALAAAGARVVLACRDVGKGEKVAAELGDGVQVRRLDLADLDSVREFVDGLAASHEVVDVLINNAGVMAVPLRRTADGFEMQIGTNHLGHFALTALLLGRITDRVVTVSSAMHRIGRIDLDDLNWEHRRYDRWLAYGQSKLANLLFAYELQRRLTERESPVRSLVVHPGYSSTNLQFRSETLYGKLMELSTPIIGQSPAMGALPSLYAATVPDVEPGGFYGPDSFFEMRGHPKRVQSSARSRDEDVASRLWALSEKLCGVDMLSE